MGENQSFGQGGASEDHARGDDLDDPIFVETASAQEFLRANSRCPFVVGAKGAGKSLLLFKRKVKARQTSGTLVLPRELRAYVPSQAFADLVALSHYWQLWDKDGPRLASWTALWQWALLRTIVSGWRRQAFAQRNADQLEYLKRLARRCHEELDPDEPEEDPFALIRKVLTLIESGQAEKKGILLLPTADEYTQFVTAHADRFPQTYVFLDNYDEFFDKNAEFWIASSMGTFLASRHIRQVSRARIHFSIALRPEVVWRLQREDNNLVWDQEIHRIEWQGEELLELFQRRIQQLDPKLLRSPWLVDADPMKAFLGEDLARTPGGPPMLRNKRAEEHPQVPIYEPASDLILRNTLRRPRDLIVVGNQILLRTRRAPKGTSHWSLVRDGIDAGRKMIAEAYIAEVRHLWPWALTEATSLGAFLANWLPRNIIPRDEAAAIERKFAASIGKPVADVTPISLLTSIGLIGYVAESATGPVQRFEKAGETATYVFPRSDFYLVNPILYGDPFNIDVVKGIVVGRDLPFDRVYATELLRGLQLERTEGRGTEPPPPPGGSAEEDATTRVGDTWRAMLDEEKNDETEETDAATSDRADPPSKPASRPRRKKKRAHHVDEPTRVVFLAANPASMTEMKLTREANRIEQGVRMATGANRLQLITRWAVRIEDLIRALQEHRPKVVHFSGHASHQGIFLESEGNAALLVQARALQRVFAQFRSSIRLVVLNACSTVEQAQAISEVIDFVVGTREPISDKAAQAFSAVFYEALGHGQPLRRAFELGVAAVDAHASQYAEYLELFHRPDQKPERVSIVRASGV